jgi:hypothetical protein
MKIVKKYQKLPVIIEAIQLTSKNINEVREFIGAKDYAVEVIDYTQMAIENGVPIETLEGVMTANMRDYIIKGVNGEFYPCKPDIFEKTYKPAPNDFLERLEEEHHELYKKTTALRNFFENDTYDSLNDIQQSLLRMQYTTMGLYKDILSQRISNIRNETGR